MHPALGPELGGTIVTITAAGLSLGHPIYCQFGSASTPAFVRSETQLSCVSAVSVPGNCSLRLVSFSNSLMMDDVLAPLQHASNMHNMFLFQVQTSAHVAHLVPPTGPVLGGRAIIVRGYNFEQASGSRLHRCRFGHAVVSARLLNSTALVCASPRQAAGKVPLEVSLNNQDYTTSGVLFDVAALSITRVWPNHGPAAGGTELTVDLDGAPNERLLFCRFGRGESQQLVPAVQSADGSAVNCRTPSHLPSSIAFSLVSMEDNAEASATFEFVADPTVISSMPQRALLASLTPIFVHGRHFINSSSLGCAFGSTRINASFITNTTIVCVAPFWKALVHGEMRVHLRVTTNGNDFSATSTVFDFVPCPEGLYCSHLQALPCPWGTFCSAHGGRNFTACSPGTYQSRSGRGSCQLCPIGFYCPASGLSEPLICAAGMVCSMPGLSFPNVNCPAGHFCPPGVESLDPILSDANRRPIECPENTWCSPGVAENVTRPGNMSTPQPCLSGFVCYRGSNSPTGSGPCPSGYYCPPNSLPIECPPAHYCPGVGNVFPSQCTPGFYNDRFGRNKCIECPIGFICDRTGLSHPTICPAGAVCNEPGLKVPSLACPPGCMRSRATRCAHSWLGFMQ